MDQQAIQQALQQQQANPKQAEENRKKQEEIMEKRKMMLQNLMTNEARERRKLFYLRYSQSIVTCETRKGSADRRYHNTEWSYGSL